MIVARLAQDIPDFRFPDNSVYEATDRICEEISRKQASNAGGTEVKCEVSTSYGHDVGHGTTNEPEIRLVNQIDFSIKGAWLIDRVSTHFLTRWIWQIVNNLCSCQNCNIAMF